MVNFLRSLRALDRYEKITKALKSGNAELMGRGAREVADLSSSDAPVVAGFTWARMLKLLAASARG